MKKIISLMLVSVLALSFASCSKKSYMNENETTAAASNNSGEFAYVTVPEYETEETTEDFEAEEKENAMEAAKAFLGEKDKETGMEYLFSHDGTEVIDGTEYRKIRVSLAAEDGTHTFCGYLLADSDGNVQKYQW